MINVGIAGATGYTGQELISLLARHPMARISALFSTTEEPKPIAELIPEFKNRIDLICTKLNLQALISKCDFIFLALPHTVSMGITPKLLQAKKKVIDLSGDYRIKDIKVYERFYCHKQSDKINLKKAVYGLPELYRAGIKKADLVANPGCYSTAAILALTPIAAFDLADLDSIVIDAKSGVSGAGKKATAELLFCEVNENFMAYKINIHQHIPEINQELSKLAGKKLNVTFVPHLLPLNRGILETIYIKKHPKAKNNGLKLLKLYRKFYKKEPFVRILDEGKFPRIKDVAYTNFCDIGIKEEPDKIIIIAAIDNLLKGAAGQAVQNMNIMCGFPEETALG